MRRGLVLHPLHDRSPEPISIRPQERRELPRQELGRHDAVYVGDHSGRVFRVPVQDAVRDAVGI